MSYKLVCEISNLSERQQEGIAIDKQQGKYKGRKEVDIKNFDDYYSKYQNRMINKSQLAKELVIIRPTLYRVIKEYKES